MRIYRPKVAAVVTAYSKHSHAQHILDRFLYGYGWSGTHHRPARDLVSLYVDQVGQGDLSRSHSKQFPSIKVYPTIAEALTLGGSKLAVDGLVVVGEHVHLHRAPAAMAKAPAGNSAAAV